MLDSILLFTLVWRKREELSKVEERLWMGVVNEQ